MTEQMPAVSKETYQRRRALLAATVLSSLGVLALMVRESADHPGRSNTVAILTVGVFLYVGPFALMVDRAMRRGTTRMSAAAVIGAGGAVFLATRPVGSFSQVWPVFTVIVTIVAMQVVGQLSRAGLPSARVTTTFVPAEPTFCLNTVVSESHPRRRPDEHAAHPDAAR